jgi:hypothetical protein
MFTDIKLGLHWHPAVWGDNVLWDDDYRIGRVYTTFDHKRWVAEPFWVKASEGISYFDSEEEAKSYLVAIYKFQ